ncbi:MAG TPA: FAD-dependent oxidoreductase [Blastocatellia bacterium]|jgi:2-polyprenyl-6-methoxyphenol hydroxylase-like FAD-dependent oxidoreductase|nr:FAD-dependent oxidoreductase [Blastocatellia bacterium]
MNQPQRYAQQIRTTCCVVGGGPAGMMLGLLLARAGVEAIVLEKHADFFRDFRGDTIHPSTLELLHELGMLDEFLRLPHQELRRVKVKFEDKDIVGPDFSHLPTRCKFIAMMPQWDFLNFLTAQAKRYPTFQLLMNTEATGLIEEGGRVAGVRAKTEQGELNVLADLVVGADGRSSVMRERGGMEVQDFGVPIDVLWFRVAKTAPETEPALGRVRNGKMLVTIDRGDYYQCGSIIRKGAFEEIKRRGLMAFREEIVSVAPFLQGAIGEIDDWDKVKLLTVQVNRLRQWYRPGLLFIGDAAHAMSPAGGVGINLAIQDAVAAANLLADKLRQGDCGIDDLRRAQQRREWPARMTQNIQVFIHRQMFGSTSDPERALSIPWPVRALLWLLTPLLRRVAARVIGIGLRAERIRTQERSPQSTV